MIKEVRTRFAPSPTGYLHIGGLRTAMYAYLFAKNNNGKFILRIEDTDSERYVEGAVEIIYKTLKDAGLNYDEGPDVGGDFGPYIQTERKNTYLKYAQQLVENGGAYYCFCTKERLEELHSTGATKYDKHCLSLSKEEIDQKLKNGEPYVIRQLIPEEGETSYDDLVFGKITVSNKDMEDGILIKSDGLPTYNFANVVDDHLMEISHVIRGTEYLSSTPKYNLIYKGLGWDTPEYMHLPPIMKDAHQKLSKRNGDASFNDLVEKGFLKDAIINYIALLGWSPKENTEKLTLKEIQEKFSIEGLSKSPSIFDPAKLTWLNGEYIKELSIDEFNKYALPFYEGSDIKGMFDYTKLSALLSQRIEVFNQIPEKINFLAHFDDFNLELFTHKKSKTDSEIAKQVLTKAIDSLSKIENWTHENIHNVLIGLVEEMQMKNSQVLWCVRIGATGTVVTPGGATEMLDILGKELSLQRLNKSLSRLLENWLFKFNNILIQKAVEDSTAFWIIFY